MKGIHVGSIDNVATAIEPLQVGEEVLGVVIKEPIPKGHKFATERIAKGSPVIKYDSHIGVAEVDIEPGQWGSCSQYRRRTRSRRLGFGSSRY